MHHHYTKTRVITSYDNFHLHIDTTVHTTVHLNTCILYHFHPTLFILLTLVHLFLYTCTKHIYHLYTIQANYCFASLVHTLTIICALFHTCLYIHFHTQPCSSIHTVYSSSLHYLYLPLVLIYTTS